MTNAPVLRPTTGNAYVLVYPQSHGGENDPYDFANALKRSHELERTGKVEQACNLRYEAFRRLMEVIPDEEEITLEWESEENQAAIALIRFSAIDHFLIGDFEMAAAISKCCSILIPKTISKQRTYWPIAISRSKNTSRSTR